MIFVSIDKVVIVFTSDFVKPETDISIFQQFVPTNIFIIISVSYSVRFNSHALKSLICS